MNLPLSGAFTVSHRFWVVVFSFSFISMHILISFLISSMTCWLFRSVLFRENETVLSLSAHHLRRAGVGFTVDTGSCFQPNISQDSPINT